MSIRATDDAVNQQPRSRLTAALARLLPERCALCGGAAGPMGFCEPCHQALPRHAGGVGGMPGYPPLASHRHDGGVSSILVPFRYGFPLRELIHRFKYRGQRQLGRPLGLLLAENLNALNTVGDVLVPMPLHRSRLIERGYNQSFELARPVARETRLPIWVQGISRARATRSQAGLSLSARRDNVENAFFVSRNVAGARVLIIDDVLTTGATANALARALSANHAAAVSVVALARG